MERGTDQPRTSSAGATRLSLVARLGNHDDSQAWRDFVQLYTPLVYGFCRRQGLQEADAADVAQETLTQVAHSIRSFVYDRERGRFRDWLGAIVRSKISRHFRKRQAQTLDPVSDSAPDPLDRFASPEAVTEWEAVFHDYLLRVALERVRSDYDDLHWQAFERVWRDGEPVAEVAASLGLTLAAVYLTKSRLLKRLRAEIEALTDDAAHWAKS